MTDSNKLRLIVEAVQYCQRVRALGMPKTCYAKALREPIFFLWEKQPGRNKYACSRFRSVAAKGRPDNGGGLIYDHAIPFNYTLEKLLALTSIDPETVRTCLLANVFSCTLTTAEDARLREAGLASVMPADWDGTDPLSRYRAVGIQVYEQNSLAP